MKKALLIIDMINDIVHREGFLGKQSYNEFMNQNNVLEKINKLIQREKSNNTEIIFINLGFSEDYIEKPKNSSIFNFFADKGLFIKNTWGTEIIKGINIDKNFKLINKYQVSAISENLCKILFNNNIEELLLCGVSTHLAIESTVRQAHDYGYKVVVYEDCCIDSNIDEHESALNSFKNFCTILKIENNEK